MLEYNTKGQNHLSIPFKFVHKCLILLLQNHFKDRHKMLIFEKMATHV
jgi:hypothetical protein